MDWSLQYDFKFYYHYESFWSLQCGQNLTHTHSYAWRHLCYPTYATSVMMCLCVRLQCGGYTTAGPEGAARESTLHTSALHTDPNKLRRRIHTHTHTHTWFCFLSLTIAPSNVYFYSLSRNVFTLGMPSLGKAASCRVLLGIFWTSVTWFLL